MQCCLAHYFNSILNLSFNEQFLYYLAFRDSKVFLIVLVVNLNYHNTVPLSCINSKKQTTKTTTKTNVFVGIAKQ